MRTPCTVCLFDAIRWAFVVSVVVSLITIQACINVFWAQRLFPTTDDYSPTVITISIAAAFAEFVIVLQTGGCMYNAAMCGICRRHRSISRAHDYDSLEEYSDFDSSREMD